MDGCYEDGKLKKHRPVDFPIDLLDRKILYLLKQNSRLSSRQISKKVRASPEVVNYRIKRLIRNKYINYFYTHINFPRLGYKLYRIYLTTQYFTHKKMNEMLKFATENRFFEWGGRLDSHWDFEIVLYVKDEKELTEFLEDFNKRFKKYYRDICIFKELYYTNLTYEFLLNRDREFNTPPRAEINYFDPPVNIDEKDKKILKEMMFNANINMVTLAKKVGVTLPTLLNRIKRLKKDKIILEYTVNIPHDAFGFMSYKIIVDSLPEAKKKILQYLKMDRYVVKINRWLGEGDICFTVRVPNEKEKDIIIHNLRTLCGSEIRWIKHYKVSSLVGRNASFYFR